MKKYRVHTKFFTDIEKAKKACQDVFEKTGIICAIEEFSPICNERKLPKYIEKEILTSYRNCQDSFHYVGFKNTTDKLNDWLTKTLGITSCDNETTIQNTIFKFDWSCQRWMVR